MRLGGTETIKVDVRILAASNEDLKKLVREGRFREDLFHRLNVISHSIAAAARAQGRYSAAGDAISRAILPGEWQAGAHFTHEAMKLLMDYDWPGNVRELENAVERGVVLSTQETMDADLLPESVRIARDRQRRARAAFRIPAGSGRIGSGRQPRRPRRSSKFWKKSNGASLWTCSSAQTGTRRKRPSDFRFRFPRSIRKSSGSASRRAGAQARRAVQWLRRRIAADILRRQVSDQGFKCTPLGEPVTLTESAGARQYFRGSCMAPLRRDERIRGNQKRLFQRVLAGHDRVRHAVGDKPSKWRVAEIPGALWAALPESANSLSDNRGSAA